jgi:hypothetical protein
LKENEHRALCILLAGLVQLAKYRNYTNEVPGRDSW